MLLFNGCNKIVTLNNDAVTAEILIRKSIETFPKLQANDAISLQRFDDDFHEYADIELHEEVPPKSKIKIRVQSTPDQASTSGIPSTSGDNASDVTNNDAEQDQGHANDGVEQDDGAEQAQVQRYVKFTYVLLDKMNTYHRRYVGM